MAPDPGGDIFRGRILQPFDFVQAMVVEPFQQCRERSLNVEEVHHKAGGFVDLPLEYDFDAVRMTVHSVAAVLNRYFWKPVRRLKSKRLHDLHRTLMALCDCKPSLHGGCDRRYSAESRVLEPTSGPVHRPKTESVRNRCTRGCGASGDFESKATEQALRRIECLAEPFPDAVGLLSL